MKAISRILVVIFTTATLIVNFLSVSGQINNTTPQMISDTFPVFFIPAGYAFSIWGVIYIGLIAYSIYQFKHKEEKDLSQISLLYILSCLANISWIFLWHYFQPVWSVLPMSILLISLILIYSKLDIGLKKVSTARQWMVNIPFSIYLGWISVAIISNIFVALYVLDFDGFGITPQTWAAIMIILATIIAQIMLITRKDYSYATVILWGITAIAYRFQLASTIFNTVVLSSGVLIITALGEKLQLHKFADEFFKNGLPK